MGLYIDPDPMQYASKEHWLNKHGVPMVMSTFIWRDLPPDWLPVILVQNVDFTAAGIITSEQDWQSWRQNKSDTRPRLLYLCRIADLECVTGRLWHPIEQRFILMHPMPQSSIS